MRVTGTAVLPAEGGVLLVNKDVGPTSNRVVQEVRRALGGVKAGHAGTLDPIAGGLLGSLFRGEKLGRYWILATMLAISGCTLVSFTGGTVTVDLAGILLAIGAGIFYAAFTLVLKGLLQDNAAVSVVAVVFCLGALLLSPLLLTTDINWLLQPRAIGITLHLGVLATAVPYLLFAWGLRTIQVSTATTLSLAEPMTAATLGIVILGEQMNLQAGSGIVLIFIGLAVLIWSGRDISRGAIK